MKNSNTEHILSTFLRDKESLHPISKKPLPKEKRIDSMYIIVMNRVYGTEYSKEDRILASTLITEILKED